MAWQIWSIGLGRGVPAKRERPGGQLVQHHPQAEEVGAGVDLLPQRLLRAHVGNGPHHHPDLGLGLGAELGVEGRRVVHRLPRQPEVQDLDLPLRRDHRVGGLDVPVHDARAVGLLQGRRHLQPQVHHAPHLEGAPGHESAEVLPLHVLHGDVVGAVLLPHVVDVGDVGVAQGGGGTGLPLEPLPVLHVRRELGGEDLHRHRPLEPHVPGAVDLPHAPRPEGRDDLVGAETVAGLQAHGNTLSLGTMGDSTPPSPREPSLLIGRVLGSPAGVGKPEAVRGAQPTLETGALAAVLPAPFPGLRGAAPDGVADRDCDAGDCSVGVRAPSDDAPLSWGGRQAAMRRATVGTEERATRRAPRRRGDEDGALLAIEGLNLGVGLGGLAEDCDDSRCRCLFEATLDLKPTPRRARLKTNGTQNSRRLCDVEPSSAAGQVVDSPPAVEDLGIGERHGLGGFEPDHPGSDPVDVEDRPGVAAVEHRYTNRGRARASGASHGSLSDAWLRRRGFLERTAIVTRRPRNGGDGSHPLAANPGTGNLGPACGGSRHEHDYSMM